MGLPDDAPIRTDESGYPVNRMFADVEQDEPEVEAEPGCEGEVQSFNLFAYLSRSDVTWNPSVCTVLRDSLFCPTSEEFSLPVEHGNDRVEWFIQLSDEIIWNVKDKESGRPSRGGDHAGGATSPACRPTSAIRASRPSARCCWCGRTPRRRSPR